MASLQWDSAELLQIGIQDHMSYDDAFTIEKVINFYLIFQICMHFVQIDEELIKKFTFVAGIVPVIKAYIKEVEIRDIHIFSHIALCVLYIYS